MPRERRHHANARRRPLPDRAALSNSADINIFGRRARKHHLRSSAGAFLAPRVLPLATSLPALPLALNDDARRIIQYQYQYQYNTQHPMLPEELAAALRHAPPQLVESFFGADVAAGRSSIPPVRLTARCCHSEELPQQPKCETAGKASHSSCCKFHPDRCFLPFVGPVLSARRGVVGNRALVCPA